MKSNFFYNYTVISSESLFQIFKEFYALIPIILLVTFSNNSKFIPKRF